MNVQNQAGETAEAGKIIAVPFVLVRPLNDGEFWFEGALQNPLGNLWIAQPTNDFELLRILVYIPDVEKFIPRK